MVAQSWPKENHGSELQHCRGKVLNVDCIIKNRVNQNIIFTQTKNTYLTPVSDQNLHAV